MFGAIDAVQWRELSFVTIGTGRTGGCGSRLILHYCGQDSCESEIRGVHSTPTIAKIAGHTDNERGQQDPKIRRQTNLWMFVD